ncbi:MAG TPA: hypothetical protein ACFYEF_08995, partial [Candidatus Wunengus sp. YC63]|uniref:hypothetical protein n=1 Tax=Candidatus Wunengus sp. YC63 TaxID=3367699 RepID=UPI00402736F9
MKIMKFTMINYLLSFVVVNIVILTVTATDESERQIGYGRGGRMQGGAVSERSKEPIQPIPISFDYDRPKIE